MMLMMACARRGPILPVRAAGPPWRPARAGHGAPVPEVVRSALVERTPREMFALVDAVEDYPQFLPWCGAATVIQRDEAVTRATIEIDYRGIRQSFTTENLKRLPEEM